MSELLLKYNALDDMLQKEVLDFIDFLLYRKNSAKNVSLSEFKKNILEISTWSEDDISLISSVSKYMNK